MEALQANAAPVEALIALRHESPDGSSTKSVPLSSCPVSQNSSPVDRAVPPVSAEKVNQPGCISSWAPFSRHWPRPPILISPVHQPIGVAWEHAVCAFALRIVGHWKLVLRS